MYTSDNLTSSSVSSSSLSSNDSSTPKHYFSPTAPSQVPTAIHIPSSPLPSLHNTTPLPQQSFQYPYPNESQLQTISKDELDLILSFRRMKNLSYVSSLYPPLLSSTYPHAHGITSHPATSSDYRTGYQIAPSTLLAPSYHHASSSIYPYVTSTTLPQQLLCAQQILCQPISSSPPSITATLSSPPPLTTTASSPPPLTTTASSPLPSPLAMSSPPPSPLATSSTSPSPLATSSMSPIQQEPIPSNQNISASRQPHQSTYSQATTTYQYNPVITGPTVQLLDQTKPYQTGDKIKVGGRTLQSDPSSLKYWLEDDITITESTSGGQILNMAGYSYFVKNIGKNFTTWECDHRRHHQCSLIIIRSSNPTTKNYFRIYSIQGEHIHEPSSDDVETRKFKQRVRDRCRQELSCPRTIYDDELMRGKYSSQMLTVLPTFYNMPQLYRIRQEHLPASPTDPSFVLHPGFTSTDQGARFLLYDSNAVQAPYVVAPTKVGRLVIYTSDLQLNILSKSKRISSDGTFETAPQISYQNYIIMGEFEEKHPVPLVFCLCERKNYECYKLIIQILKTVVANLKLDFKPEFWMSDYESGLTKAIKEELDIYDCNVLNCHISHRIDSERDTELEISKQLPNTQLLGCAFHYSQAIYRNIQYKGLQDAYKNLEVIRQPLRQIMALAFVPNGQIKTAYYDIIKPQLNNVPPTPSSLRHNMRDFFKYFESYWLRRIKQFCVFDHPTRTNNGLEGYNNKMNAQLSAHPHLYRLILWFEKEELLVRQLVTKVSSDILVHRRKQAATTVLINDTLQSLWNTYKGGTISQKNCC